MRYALPLYALLVVAAFSLSGCRGARSTVGSEDPQARATRMPGFNPQAYKKIAVLVRDNTDAYYSREGGMRRRVEDVFEQAAARKGYHLATRSQVEAIKKEIRFQDETHWTEPDPAKPGHLFNVSALLIVSINSVSVREEPSRVSKIPEPNREGFFSRLVDNVLESAPREIYYSEASVSADLISVREGAVLWSGRYTGAVQIKEGQPEGRAIPAVSQVVAGALPPR